tara:strand:+ start:42 stop:536 length:495 start_codon:yes stop_codon:yes gene_type:complete
MGVNKLYNAYQAGKQIYKTVKSPITHARNIIKSTFTKAKKKIGGTEKSDEIKKAVGIKKKVEKLEKQSEANIKKGKTMLSRDDMVQPTKNLRDIKRTKRDADKFVKETLRRGFNKGSKDPVGKKKNGKTPFGMLSVKAGIDKNPNPTQADRIAGAKMKNKKKVI